MSTESGRRIVVGVDGSESALRAVRWAADEARRHQAELRLVHAVELLTGYAPRVVDWQVLQTAMKDRGRLWLDQAREEAGRAVPGLRVDAVLETTSPVVALVRASRDAALVVLGSRGLGGFSGLVIGSTAVAVAGHANTPVVVVRGDATDGADGAATDGAAATAQAAAGQAAAGPAAAGGPVVVGVDGTPTGEAAIAFAFAQASARGADLVAVHAWTDLVIEAAYLGGAAALDFAPLEQQAAETLAERLAGWQEKYPDVHVIREVVRERTVKALLRNSEHAQLVVVGTRGRGGFRGLLLGSTSQHLLQHATCPVAVVRTRKDDED